MARINVGVTTGAPPFFYTWSNGKSTRVIDSLPEGDYQLNIRNVAGCEKDFAFHVNDVIYTITVDPTIHNDICKGNFGSIAVSGGGGTAPYKYLWSNDSTGQSLVALPAGTYTIKIKDVNNCEGNFSLNVEDDECPEIVVHDVITPNGDGVNDVWVIEGLQNYVTNYVQLFDKWGNRVFEKSNYRNDWYGIGSKGESLPDGTYYYLIKLNRANVRGGRNVWKGAMLIKR